ncbi:MAG: type III-A CRISPR-associated protein Csm2 [Desulfobulbaceae bacterium]|jgi:CRISPR-associated protein Csm2|nr:type III-A CRISPR-associated protein Csm2 [Deltaproteobacteria bacterium]MDY0352277.1 type III-A CRISPR-associated protein Csm2 [Desulfobulbaceae bacterium]
MASINLWKDKANRKLEPTLFSLTAEELAKGIGGEGRNINKSTQLRRYYDEVVRLATQAKASGADMDLILPQVHMLVAKVAYARGRNLVGDSFVELMKSGISQVNDKEDLQVFANFLESFMGFYKVHGPK